VFELLRYVTEQCITNDHLVLAEEFAGDLYNLANEKDDLFYRGESNFLIGYLALKKGDEEVLETALNNIRDAAIDFEKVKDYAGAGMCFYKIGTIYQSRLNKLDNSSLFYREAIENYNKAILRSHPLRKSLWSKPESLVDKIRELRDLLDELIPNIENQEIKKKVIEDLKSIKYNF
jgi:tetratricopeptide (TPR) repeat protein